MRPHWFAILATGAGAETASEGCQYETVCILEETEIFAFRSPETSGCRFAVSVHCQTGRLAGYHRGMRIKGGKLPWSISGEETLFVYLENYSSTKVWIETVVCSKRKSRSPHEI